MRSTFCFGNVGYGLTLMFCLENADFGPKLTFVLKNLDLDLKLVFAISVRFHVNRSSYLTL